MEDKPEYEVRPFNNKWKVYNTKTETCITKEIPNEYIAKTIAADMNRMAKGDYRPIGGPDMSNDLIN